MGDTVKKYGLVSHTLQPQLGKRKVSSAILVGCASLLSSLKGIPGIPTFLRGTANSIQL